MPLGAEWVKNREAFSGQKKKKERKRTPGPFTVCVIRYLSLLIRTIMWHTVGYFRIGKRSKYAKSKKVNRKNAKVPNNPA